MRCCVPLRISFSPTMGKKRSVSAAPAVTHSKGRPGCVPSVASMSQPRTEQTSKQSNVGVEVAGAEVHISVAQYCDDCSVYGPDFKNRAMQQVLLRSGATPTPLFYLKKAIGLACVAQIAAGDDTMPKSYGAFGSDYMMKFAFHGKQ